MEETIEELNARRDRIDRKKDEMICQLMEKNDECQRKITEQNNELIKIRRELFQTKYSRISSRYALPQFKQDQRNCNVLSNEDNVLMDQKEAKKNPEVTNSIPSSVRYVEISINMKVQRCRVSTT